MVGWHPQLNEHEFVQTPGDGEGQGCLGVLPPMRLQSWAQPNDWTTTDQPHLRPRVPHPPHFLVSLYVRILRFLPHNPDTGSPLASPADRLEVPPRRPLPGGTPASHHHHAHLHRCTSIPGALFVFLLIPTLIYFPHNSRMSFLKASEYVTPSLKTQGFFLCTVTTMSTWPCDPDPQHSAPTPSSSAGRALPTNSCFLLASFNLSPNRFSARGFS